jgi:hypothetical protein
MIQDTVVYLKNAGRMNKNLIPVESHVTDIPERLKEINPHFLTMFNPSTQKYEVHRLDVDGPTLELSLPYDELDVRAIQYALHAREVEKVRAEIEENNRAIDEAKQKAIEDEQRCKTRDLHKYVTSHESKEVLDEGAYKTRFV